jgi:hypothetical protein
MATRPASYSALICGIAGFSPTLPSMRSTLSAAMPMVGRAAA